MLLLISFIFLFSIQDAHVCILDFDDDVSLFGVFDGHGGAEVAQYAVEALPSFIKNELFENGDYEKALIKAFMDFDDSLTKPLALRRMRALRLKNVKAEKSGKFSDSFLKKNYIVTIVLSFI